MVTDHPRVGDSTPGTVTGHPREEDSQLGPVTYHPRVGNFKLGMVTDRPRVGDWAILSPVESGGRLTRWLIPPPRRRDGRGSEVRRNVLNPWLLLVARLGFQMEEASGRRELRGGGRGKGWGWGTLRKGSSPSGEGRQAVWDLLAEGILSRGGWMMMVVVV